MKHFLTYLIVVLVLSVALVSASPGRGDSGPPDIVQVVTNHQTEAINAVTVNTITVPAAIDERPQVDHVLLIKEKAVINRAPVFDPFYNERRWGERIQYYLSQRNDIPGKTDYHLRC
jgi:hypothetical protein